MEAKPCMATCNCSPPGGSRINTPGQPYTRSVLCSLSIPGESSPLRKSDTASSLFAPQCGRRVLGSCALLYRGSSDASSTSIRRRSIHRADPSARFAYPLAVSFGVGIATIEDCSQAVGNLWDFGVTSPNTRSRISFSSPLFGIDRGMSCASRDPSRNTNVSDAPQPREFLGWETSRSGYMYLRLQSSGQMRVQRGGRRSARRDAGMCVHG